MTDAQLLTLVIVFGTCPAWIPWGLLLVGTVIESLAG
jgi:hypothetical protein